MAEPFKCDIRPDAWIDWTYIETDADRTTSVPILAVRQYERTLHFTPRTAYELEQALAAWRASLA